MKVRINNRKNFNYLIIIIFGIIISLPLMANNLNVYFNEGFYGIAEGFEFTKNINFNDGRVLTSFFYYFGTGNIILNSPLIPIMLYIGNRFLDSFIITHKLIMFLSIIISGYYMHKYTEKVTQNFNIALLSAILYMNAPIHLGQIYFTNSLKTSLIFVFIPITFLGLYKLFNTTENSFHLGVGIIGLVLTDLSFTVLFSFPIIIYFIINIKNWRLEHVRRNVIIIVLAIISITSFFIFPYIEAKSKVNYEDSNVSKSDFLDSRFSIKDLFVTNNNSKVIVELGPHIMVILAFSLLSLHKQNGDTKKELIFYLIMIIVYIFMSLKIFPWGLFPEWIAKIENSYNFLIIALFFECIVCGININSILNNFKLRDVFVISLISLFYLFALKGCIQYSDDIQEISYYDLSEVVEYKLLPKKSKEKLENLVNRSNEVEVISGTGEIYDKHKYLTNYSFKANTKENGTVYELPYLYYPGYEIRYDGIEMEYFESDNGLIAIKMNKEEGTSFDVKYIGTNITHICKIISFIRIMFIWNLYIQKTINLEKY